MNIEHANMTVSDLDAATRFLMTAFPSAIIRGEGLRPNQGRWRHIGDQIHYIALQQEAEPVASSRQRYVENGVNHLGLVVDDLAGLMTRLQKAGYESSDGGVQASGRSSVYFEDGSGNEWEFVEYHSDIDEIRNPYD